MDLAFIGLALNSLIIAAIVFHQYISGKTYDLIANFANISATLLLACALLVLFAIWMPTDPEMKGGFMTLPPWVLYIPAGLVFLYLLSRLKSNESRFSYIFFALMVAQQVWHAYAAASPYSAMMLLAFAYVAFAIAIFTLGGLAGTVLSAIFPKQEQKHRDWANSIMNDKYYQKRPIPVEVKFVIERINTTPPILHVFNNPLALRSNDWGRPADIASGLIIYALLNPILFSLL